MNIQSQNTDVCLQTKKAEAVKTYKLPNLPNTINFWTPLFLRFNYMISRSRIKSRWKPPGAMEAIILEFH